MKSFSEIGKCPVCQQAFRNYRCYCEYQVISGYVFYYCPNCEIVPIESLGRSCERCGDFFWGDSCYSCKISKSGYHLPTFD